MAYPHTHKLTFPLEKYRVNSYRFRQDCAYGNVHWGIHLGEDINRSAGTKVRCIGRGRVVYSALHAGTKDKGNWGNIVIIVHKHPKTKTIFFSLYAHLQKRLVKKGQSIDLGQVIGTVGKTNSPENGWWEDEHLHFAIYVGHWEKKVLPGYWKKGSKKTKLTYWKEPTRFINNYKT
ncbi:M23 family metallopeptidase [Candidatus Parcubacteria bacterium]|nr:M23 family metallopeptidase [Candidatus Parcubacteria bacterium]